VVVRFAATHGPFWALVNGVWFLVKRRYYTALCKTAFGFWSNGGTVLLFLKRRLVCFWSNGDTVLLFLKRRLVCFWSNGGTMLLFLKRRL
jgi:hypothetical protein